MRYIRTKDGMVIDLTKCANPNLFKSMAIKQADNIGYLTDICIARNKNYPNIIFSIRIFEIDDELYADISSIGEDDELLDAFLLDYDCYGYIELPNILKCVAKMKGILSNGEIDWELL